MSHENGNTRLWESKNLREDPMSLLNISCGKSRDSLDERENFPDPPSQNLKTLQNSFLTCQDRT